MKIHFIQPYAVDKNIGKAYNEACAAVPADDWVCITDQDSCFLHPHSGKQLYDIINTTGKDYALLGCMTNRLKSGNQCYAGVRSEDPNILHHAAIARNLFADDYDTIERCIFTIAGMLMLFPKSTWEKVKFGEHSYMFDRNFSWDILHTGGKLGLMKGVYRFHFYRFDKENASQDISHLI